jgi:hypothetical protein
MLFLLLESSNTLCNYLMYLDYTHIQLVFDLVMDQWKMKYIIIIIIIIIICILLNQSECIFPLNSRVKVILCAMQHICTWLFCGKMHYVWFNKIKILQGRWQHGEKVGYRYPSEHEKTLCKWDIYVPLVLNGLMYNILYCLLCKERIRFHFCSNKKVHDICI